MKNILTLFGLCPPLATILLGRYNSILARLNILAFQYAGSVEIDREKHRIIFRFPLYLDDVAKKDTQGIAVFYLDSYGYRCCFGDDTPKPWFAQNHKTARFFSRYRNEFDDTKILDWVVIGLDRKGVYNHYHICQEFEDSNLNRVRIYAAFRALEDHLEKLKQSLNDGFDDKSKEFLKEKKQS